MKPIVQTALFFVFIQWSMAGPPIAVPVATATSVKALLSELPPQSHLWQYHSLVNNPPKESDAGNQALARARQQVAKVHEAMPRLRKLLTVGASVFAYPGLLAHGDISYCGIGKGDPFATDEPMAMGYRLRMGLPVGITNHRFEFEVVFDSAGIILGIEDLHGKE